MVDNINDEDLKLYNISINFVNSLFSDNKVINSNKIKIKVIRNKSKELNQKKIKNPKSFNQNISKDNLKTNKNNNLTFTTTSKNKFKLDSNDKNSNNKILYTEKTSKTMVSNYLHKHTRQLGKNGNDENEQKRYNTFNNTDSSAYEIYKAKQESLKEKKLYEERVKILKNHIIRLKKQEEELNKKAEINKEKEMNKNKKKKEKEIMKRALLSIEIDRRNELKEKKKNIII